MNRFIVFICLISISNFGFTQSKYEKEMRIKEKEVPVNVVSFVDSMNLPNKIKWYKETGYNKSSYEAKTRYDAKRLSIEFSENGTFEDFEIEINPGDILPGTYKKISDYLLNVHKEYLIEKVQIQYSGDPKLILDYFINSESAKGLIIHYEVVISTKEESEFVMFEYLFDENGVFVKKAQIKITMTDNIEY